MVTLKAIAIGMGLGLGVSMAAPLVYEGGEGVGKGKNIVFLANDHEYRSEEISPLLAKLLAQHQGFKCKVLFGADEEGNILPGAPAIPDLEVLKEADLLVFFARFMNLPAEEVQHIADYLERGGPVIGLRTSTHAFSGQGSGWEKLNYDYKGEDYEGGIGKQVFGSTWDKVTGQSHYGKNHGEGGTYTAVESAQSHPIMTGVAPFHCYSGAYKSQPPADATPLIEVQVLNTFQPSEKINTKKPKVNAGWSRDYYTAPSGARKEARVVYSSIGASEDALDANTRRFLTNSCLWAMGLEASITPDLKVDLVGVYEPSAYCTGSLYREGVKPADLAGFDSAIMPKDAPYAGVKNGNKRLSRLLPIRPELEERVHALHPDYVGKPSQSKKK